MFRNACAKSCGWKIMKATNFFGELKRRNVYKVAVAYAVAGWALSQGIAQVFPVFDVPNWVIRLIVVLIIIGFPVALVLAWAFEITPQGIKRSEDVDVTRPLSVGLFFLGRYTAAPTQNAPPDVSAKSIAVLPFENLSDDKQNTYFADGVQDQILTKLAKVS